MKISIFGLGYVGAVSLACLSRDGHEVIGVDIDAAKLDLIMAGKTPLDTTPLGSQLWRYVERGVVGTGTVAGVQAAAQASLAWMVRAGYASSAQVTAERLASGVALDVRVEQAGTPLELLVRL